MLTVAASSLGQGDEATADATPSTCLTRSNGRPSLNYQVNHAGQKRYLTCFRLVGIVGRCYRIKSTPHPVMNEGDRVLSDGMTYGGSNFLMVIVMETMAINGIHAGLPET